MTGKILPASGALRPDLITIKTGFDGVSSDPIGGYLGLRSNDFYWTAEQLKESADKLCGGKFVYVIE